MLDAAALAFRRRMVHLAGPPLPKAATGEATTEEELGGAEMHASVFGLAHHQAKDDRDALRIARDIPAAIDWPLGTDDTASPPRSFKPPRHDREELLGVMPLDHERPVDMRQKSSRIAEDSKFLAFGENHGQVTGFGHLHIDTILVWMHIRKMYFRISCRRPRMTSCGPLDRDPGVSHVDWRVRD